MSKILRLSNFKTASRCWMPTASVVNNNNNIRLLSSNQRYINLNQHSLSDVNLISNDEILTYQESHKHTTNRIINDNNDELSFEPSVFSNDEFHTAGPVNKA